MCRAVQAEVQLQRLPCRTVLCGHEPAVVLLLCCLMCWCCRAGSLEGLDDKVIEVYRGVGQLLARYTIGKVRCAVVVGGLCPGFGRLLHNFRPYSNLHVQHAEWSGRC